MTETTAVDWLKRRRDGRFAIAGAAACPGCGRDGYLRVITDIGVWSLTVFQQCRSSLGIGDTIVCGHCDCDGEWAVAELSRD